MPCRWVFPLQYRRLLIPPGWHTYIVYELGCDQLARNKAVRRARRAARKLSAWCAQDLFQPHGAAIYDALALFAGCGTSRCRIRPEGLCDRDRSAQ